MPTLGDLPLQGCPPQKWMNTAAALVERAEGFLHDQAGKKALDALHSLGLTDDTIGAFHLGYMPELEQFSFADWGIDPSTLTQKQRAKGGVNVPDGILVPWFVDGQIWKLTVKRPGKMPEYGQIVGSMECLFNGDALQHDQPAMLVESEFEALRIWQEGCDRVCCVATGDEKKCRSARWIRDLALAGVVLQCFEADGQAEYWTRMLKNGLRWPRNNDFVGQWIEDGIQTAHMQFGLLDDPTFNISFQQYTAKQEDFWLNKQRESSLFDEIGQTPTAKGTASDVPQARILSKEEIVGRFRDEVTRLWGSCTVEELPVGMTLKQYLARQKAARYWG